MAPDKDYDWDSWPSDESLLLFGYGSLIWRPNFDFSAKHIGSISGWKRRFWQASATHRGTQEAPGRVVTLIPNDDLRGCSDDEWEAEDSAEVWGVVYELRGSLVPSVLPVLDEREKGYSKSVVAVACRDGITRHALCFVATGQLLCL